MKNKNIFVLPTDKPSRLVKIKDNLFYTTTENIPGSVYQNIFITSSDEKPRQGEWSLYQNKIHKCIEDIIGDEFKKIILTDNQDLIKDGIQAIDDEFLEWFVENPSCEEVDVYKDKRLKIEQDFDFYEIIIPKEEPKQGNFYEDLVKYFKTTPKEKVLEDWNNAHLDSVEPTVDEFLENTNKQQEAIENDDTWSLEKAKEFALNHFKRDEKTTKKGIVTWESVLDVLKVGVEVGYKFGTKWQQEQDKNRYNEEEVEKLIELHSDFIDSKIDYEGINNATTAISNPEWDDKEWFKQFKKK